MNSTRAEDLEAAGQLLEELQRPHAPWPGTILVSTRFLTASMEEDGCGFAMTGAQGDEAQLELNVAGHEGTVYLSQDMHERIGDNMGWRRGHKTPTANGVVYPRTLHVDKDGYPEDCVIDQVREVSFKWAARWLVEVLPAMVEELAPHGAVTTSVVNNTMTIVVTTGGWRGVETLVAAVRGNYAFCPYWESSQREGRTEWSVPLAGMDLSTDGPS